MSWLRRVSHRLRTLPRLGAANVSRVLLYRAALKAGMHPVQRVRFTLPAGPFFDSAAAPHRLVPCDRERFQSLALFGWVDVALGAVPPDWHRNVLNDTRLADATDWWRISDFGAQGDIKGVWEASRFAWAIAFARRARAGDALALDHLNAWIADWCARNPAYRGANWKCGQEASIRVMHLATAATIVDPRARPLPALSRLVEAHLRRIAPTVAYAVGQDNNHGTSEAAALFIGGSMLARSDVPEGERWRALGRSLLEERVARLVMRDGSFSQYSVNYHRLLMDTLVMAELWRCGANEPEFTPVLYDRAAAAAEWLRSFIAEPHAGAAPNIGANDGACLLPLSNAEITSLRPSAQLACVVFQRRWAFDATPEDGRVVELFGLDAPRDTAPAPVSARFDEGGYASLRVREAFAVVRYPRFGFRPSHADALHVDLWVGAENVLRDGGSFSYNAEPRWLRYFAGTESHNTVQFDDRDQMPRLGRFLFGDWLRADRVGTVADLGSGATFEVAYRDGEGASHARKVSLHRGALEVIDELSGTARIAVLRWRLLPAEWTPTASGARQGGFEIRVDCNVPVGRRQLVSGWESKLYGRKESVPVLEIEVAPPAILRTVVSWAQ